MSTRLKALQRLLGHDMNAIQEDAQGNLLAVLGVGGEELPIPDESVIAETMQLIEQEEAVTMTERIALIEAQLALLRAMQ